MANLLTLLIVMGAAAIVGRHLQQRWRTGSAGDALLIAARRVLPAKPLSWNALERRIWRRILASLEPGVGGAIVVPQAIIVRVSPEDLALIGTGRSSMEKTLGAELTKRARAKQWRVTASPSVVIRCDVECFSGAPIVHTHFGAIEPEPSVVPSDERRSKASPIGPTLLMADTGADTEVASHEGPGGAALGADTVPMFAYELRGPGAIRHRLDHRALAVTLGRSRANTIAFEAPVVSNRHASLSFRSGAWWLADLGSRNGTYVNGERLGAGEQRALEDRDEITLAPTGPVLTVGRVPAAGWARTA